MTNDYTEWAVTNVRIMNRHNNRFVAIITCQPVLADMDFVEAKFYCPHATADGN